MTNDEYLMNVKARHVLDSLYDGVYITDQHRRIVYWNRAAERITGWQSSEVVGRHCHEDILCHSDKNGHYYCGEAYCPLHRTMVTGKSLTLPTMVFVKTKGGNRIPLQISEAPIQDDDGTIIGGIEIFHDMTSLTKDLEWAKRIQALSLGNPHVDDPQITFHTHYCPYDIIGGDYYNIEKLDDQHYSFMVADVVGHGIASALYTMYLHSLWENFSELQSQPVAFLEKMNRNLHSLVKGGEAFATCMYGLIDLQQAVVKLCSAGGPPFIRIRHDNLYAPFELCGFPLGFLDITTYSEYELELQPGDKLLFFTDGAIEAVNAENKEIGVEGFIEILKQVGYPDSREKMEQIEKHLLRYSNAILLQDDLTVLGIHFIGE